MQIFLALQCLVYDLVYFLESSSLSMLVSLKHITVFDEVDKGLGHEKLKNSFFLKTFADDLN